MKHFFNQQPRGHKPLTSYWPNPEEAKLQQQLADATHDPNFSPIFGTDDSPIVPFQSSLSQTERRKVVQEMLPHLGTLLATNRDNLDSL